VSCVVTNTGDRAGSAVPQVYASRSTGDSADFVPRLAAFARVHLDAAESRAVELDLDPRLLARWEENESAFRIAGGTYEVRISAHASDEEGPVCTIPLKSAFLP